MSSETEKWAKSLNDNELADELVNRTLDSHNYDQHVTDAVVFEAARRLRVDHGALHRDSQLVPEKFREG